jgi:hypothetical protein
MTEEIDSAISARYSPVRWLEVASKNLPAAVAIVYASGYAIVSVFYSQLGMGAPSLLRPRIAEAGMLFLVMTAAAILIAHFVEIEFRRIKETWALSWFSIGIFHISCGLLAIVVLTRILGAGVRWVLPTFNKSPKSGLDSWTEIASFALVVFLMAFGPRWKRLAKFRYPFALASAALIVVIVMHGPLGRTEGWRAISAPERVNDYLAITGGLYFFARYEFNRAPLNLLYICTAWVRYLAPIFIFSSYIYPLMPASVGGGRAIPVTIGFASPAKPLVGMLIDETDSGFYVLASGSKRVKMIPRSLAQSVDFNTDQEIFP